MQVQGRKVVLRSLLLPGGAIRSAPCLLENRSNLLELENSVVRQALKYPAFRGKNSHLQEVLKKAAGGRDSQKASQTQQQLAS